MFTTSQSLLVFRVLDGECLVEFCEGRFGQAAWSPDGKMVAVVHITGADGFDYYGGHVSLYEVRGTG